MNIINVVVDLIESLGIRPMPTKQAFATVIVVDGRRLRVGYQVSGTMVIVQRADGDTAWLNCVGPKVIITTYTGRRNPLADEFVVDLTAPNSLDNLRSYIQAGVAPPCEVGSN